MEELLTKVDPASWRKDLDAFKEKTDAFYRKEVNQKDYKGFSGLYGSYAQRGQKANMLRLRMPAGQMSQEKMAFVTDMADKHDVNLLHFTTCQALQLHNLQPETVYDIMDKALDVGIVCMGGGGDYPRNVMCSPLTGVKKDEAFDVAPYAKAVSDFLMHFIKKEKMPRKLKVAFASSAANEPHATFRDLGFLANPDGTFDVYSAGGLGGNSRFGVKVAEHIDPAKVLYYVMAMRNLFLKHGNYENRAKARTRYMVEALGGEEAYKAAYQQELDAVMEAYKDLDLTEDMLEKTEITKTGDGSVPENMDWLVEQKQPGLYALEWHPIGGSPNVEVFKAVQKAVSEMPEVSLRIAPDETAWLINLTGKEADALKAIIAQDQAQSDFESSISCIGANICQVGIRDSQGMLKDLVKATREAGIAKDALPKIHISGCPSSCGTHQVGKLGLRGFVKVVDKKPQPAFILFQAGNDKAGQEKMGEELGVMLVKDIPEFFVELGKTVEASGMNYDAWIEANPNGVKEIAAKWL